MTVSAAEALTRETTMPGVLRTTCVLLTDRLGADACNLSRVIGELLVDLVEHSRDGRRIHLGRSYLVPDYPVTQEVVDLCEPRAVRLDDPQVDPGEAALLRELDFDALLMLPLVLDGRCWGLIEIYRADSAFRPAEVAEGTAITEAAADALARLRAQTAA